jgi:PEP-CTERM motif-containing protein
MLKLYTTVSKLALPALLLGFTAAHALAAPLCTSAGTLAGLIADGSCQFDDKVFSNFSYDFTGGTTSGKVSSPTVPAPSTVNAVFTDSGTFTHGVPDSVTLTFNLTANNTISNYQSIDLALQYQVNIAFGGNAAMTGVSGNTTAALASSNTTNTVRAVKDSCAGAGYQYGGLGSAPTENCLGFEDDPVYTSTSFAKGTGLTNHVTHGGATTFSTDATVVGAYDEVKLGGGTGTVSSAKTAGVFSFSNTFDQVYVPPSPVPEPGTLTLMGGVLVGLCICIRRLKLV